MGLNRRQTVFVNEYLKDFNASRAARAAGYSLKTAREIGSNLLTKIDIKAAIDARIMSADEAAANITDIARASMGDFFKIVEEWTYYPLPTYEIIDAREIEILDEDGEKTGETKISYWVRHVVLDLEKLVDPRYAPLIKEFSDSPKNGLGIKLYSRHDAARDILKYRGKLVDKTEVTGADGGPQQIEVVYVNSPYPVTGVSSGTSSDNPKSE